MQTKEQTNARLRAYRKRTHNQATRKYEKTKRGFVMRCYRNMLSRVTGVQSLKAHLYKGKTILDRDTFYQWTLSDDAFHNLFDTWTASGHQQRISPSINRIDPDRGYELGNMEWITHSENSRRIRRWGSINNPQQA